MAPFVELASAGAVICTVVLFLKYLHKIARCHAAERKDWLALFANHIDHNTDAIAELTRAIDRWQASQPKQAPPPQTGQPPA